ncbi:hypothetical protein HELRODRAFT_162745 [Helobdella robusta]|uniref:C2H2-type domain-containing protein n=1 Tax=Helobdella robusta TaxID=6412 RepID=T1ET27_HELRO|nr:hypothetical protein HELRODRAFT_162745 [Helobdella robusta]ESN99230.1 hypothetical protein HELRODRAFT_162745 [Helobdella robusta]
MMSNNLKKPSIFSSVELLAKSDDGKSSSTSLSSSSSTPLSTSTFSSSNNFAPLFTYSPASGSCCSPFAPFNCSSSSSLLTGLSQANIRNCDHKEQTDANSCSQYSIQHILAPIQNVSSLKDERRHCVPQQSTYDLSFVRASNLKRNREGKKTFLSPYCRSTPLIRVDVENKFSKRRKLDESSFVMPSPIYPPMFSTPHLSKSRMDSGFQSFNATFLYTPMQTNEVLSHSSKQIFWQEKPVERNVEHVNSGRGIKNPLLQNHLIKQLHEGQDLSVQTKYNEFLCRVCLKSFPLQRLLNRHVKCHTDIKRYLCTFCGKGFNDTFDLKRHTRTHTGVRPYKCEHCDKAFTQRCSLESHARKVHNVQFNYKHKERRDKLYVCEECGHSTRQSKEYFVHMKDQHPHVPTPNECKNASNDCLLVQNKKTVAGCRSKKKSWHCLEALLAVHVHGC